MVARKKSKLGVDPLAWLNEEGIDSDQASNDVAQNVDDSPLDEQVQEKSKGRIQKLEDSGSASTNLGQNIDLDTASSFSDAVIAEVDANYKSIKRRGARLARRFYERLFDQYPVAVSLIDDSDIKQQEKNLLAAINLVMKHLREPDEVRPVLEDFGRKLCKHGAEIVHYHAGKAVMIETLEEINADAWNADIEKSWSTVLDHMGRLMLAATGTETIDPEVADSEIYSEKNVQQVAREIDEDETMVASKQTMVVETAASEELSRMTSAIDGAMTAMMMIDRDFVITYANPATVSLLQKHEAVLKTVYPGFAAADIVGTNIDIFHKNPAHQRTLLSDPSNLPYQTDIHIGELIFALNVTAQIDAEGDYIGNTLEWSDVTDVREKEENIIRLQGTVDGAMTAMMMIDRDFVITYANDSTVELLTKHEQTLRSVYPGFAAKNLIGTNIDTFHSNPAHQRKLLADPSNLPYQTDISVGDLTFSLNVTAIKNLNGEYVGNALEWSDVTEARKKEEEVARLQSAVDGAQSNLMLCDENLVITYCNPSVKDMLRARQVELRKAWPNFDVKNINGTCIDIFHKNPAHQRALLKDPARLPTKAEIKVGDLEFEINATMIKGSNGEYKGNMVEWKDITEQKDAERQIQSLIEAAVAGDLSSRIKVDDYEGFLKGLGVGINELMGAIVDPVQETIRVIKGLADGNLTQNITGDFKGEFADLRDAVNSTMSKLLEMVSEIRTSSQNITSAANEISQGTTDLSQRTEQQASSLEETAASMEELTGTVRQNADNARQANQLATSAREEAGKGGDVVGKAIDAMSEINTASKKIADIISVIDEIAFQTNLLALNAAVEAARAGEQGRGFAVVAAEVRNLAQRSASAAKEIKSLINDSVDKVDEGSKLVDQSGETLMEIVNSVKKVSDIVAEIASASQEQATGIDQVNKAVTQMDEMTQQNAALVEEAAASSQAMTEQTRSMVSLMNFFDVGTTDVGSPHRAVASRPAAVQRASLSDRKTVSAPARSSSLTEKNPRTATSRPETSTSARLRTRAPVVEKKPASAAPKASHSDDEWEEF